MSSAGWALPKNRTTLHYFNEDGASLCGGFIHLGSRNATIPASADDVCKFCVIRQKRREELQAETNQRSGYFRGR